MISSQTSHKQIEVFAIFRTNKIQIKAFRWEDSVYRINTTHLITKAYKGQYPIYLFSVSNHNGAFKLRFIPNTMKWKLEEAYWK